MKRCLTVFALFIAFTTCFVPGLAFAAGASGSLAAADSLATGSALATQADDSELWVGDVQVTSANASNVKGDGISGKVSYDASSNTLTLNGATISGIHAADWYYYKGSDPVPYLTSTFCNIYQTGSKTLTVKLLGTNKLNLKYSGKSDTQAYALGKQDGAVAITGSGSLAITNTFNDYNKGIVCAGLTVGPNSTVKVTVNSTDDGCYAVQSTESITVKGALNVTAYSDEYATGVRATKDISVPSGGKIISSVSDGSKMSGSSTGVDASGLITVGGTITADVEDVDRAYGVEAGGGLTVKKGGVLTAKAQETFMGECAYGIYAAGTLTVNGTLKAESNVYGIRGDSDSGATLTVGATGDVTASGNNTAALENVKVKLGSNKLKVLAGYSYNAKEVKVSGIGDSRYVHIGVEKKANPMTAKANPLTFKASALKKKAQSVAAKKAFTVKKAKGAVTYKVAKYVTKAAKGKITVAKNGKVTVAKGLKKGTYTLKVKVSAAGNATYKAKSKTVKLKVTVK